MRMARPLILIVLSVFILAAADGLTADPKNADHADGGSQDLLAWGLDGWLCYLSEHLVDKADVWSIRDGMLVCKGEPMGYLYTDKAYQNFTLEFEYRWAPGAEPGNSGALFRINGKPQPLPRCLEAQMQHGNAGDLYGFHGMQLAGDESRLKKVENHKLGGDLTGVKKIKAAEKEPGQWNRYKVRADGPSLQAWLNGTLVNEAHDAEVVAGPIGLQSEGGEVHFRNVKLTVLPD